MMCQKLHILKLKNLEENKNRKSKLKGLHLVAQRQTGKCGTIGDSRPQIS